MHKIENEEEDGRHQLGYVFSAFSIWADLFGDRSNREEFCSLKSFITKILFKKNI